MTRHRHHQQLRCGFTTGTAAAAAVKGALLLLKTGQVPKNVTIQLLTGESLSIAVHSCKTDRNNGTVCTVIKDGGDDPDITHKAEIGARVWLASGETNGELFCLYAGEGVGQVTKPGLELPPGEPAINPGPRRMIELVVREICDAYGPLGRAEIEIFVPQGASLARKTLNPRLGILGGISILGTTGVVKPMSHEAYLATIRSAFSVARASRLTHVVLTTGRRSERFAQVVWPSEPEEAFIQIGDFFQASLEMCAAQGFDQVTLAVFFGKAVKMAQGIPHTHAAKSRLTLAWLARTMAADEHTPASIAAVRSANTARHAFDLIRGLHPDPVVRVGQGMITAAQRFSGASLTVRGIIFGYDGQVVFRQGCDSEPMIAPDKPLPKRLTP